MSRIKQLLTKKKVYFTQLGVIPFSIRGLRRKVMKLSEAGADGIEFVIPDERTLLQMSKQERKNLSQFDFDKLFLLITDIRKRSDIPLLLAAATNSFIHYGLKEFFERASECGLDAVFVTDLTPEESKDFFYSAHSYGLEISFKITKYSVNLENSIKASSTFIYLQLSDFESGDLESVLDRITKIADNKQVIVTSEGIDIDTIVAIMELVDGYRDNLAYDKSINKQLATIKNIKKRLVEHGLF